MFIAFTPKKLTRFLLPQTSKVPPFLGVMPTRSPRSVAAHPVEVQHVGGTGEIRWISDAHGAGDHLGGFEAARAERRFRTEFVMSGGFSVVTLGTHKIHVLLLKMLINLIILGYRYFKKPPCCWDVSKPGMGCSHAVQLTWCWGSQTCLSFGLSVCSI